METQSLVAKVFSHVHVSLHQLLLYPCSDCVCGISKVYQAFFPMPQEVCIAMAL